MIIDIRRAIEALVPDAKWDYSVPNEGGTELQYNQIKWSDSRQKPSWEQLLDIAKQFEFIDLQAKRNYMQCEAIQFRKAIRQINKMEEVKNLMLTSDEEIQEDWEYTTVFKRLDSFILYIIENTNISDLEMDSIFESKM